MERIKTSHVQHTAVLNNNGLDSGLPHLIQAIECLLYSLDYLLVLLVVNVIMKRKERKRVLLYMDTPSCKFKFADKGSNCQSQNDTRLQYGPVISLLHHIDDITGTRFETLQV